MEGNTVIWKLMLNQASYSFNLTCRRTRTQAYRTKLNLKNIDRVCGRFGGAGRLVDSFIMQRVVVVDCTVQLGLYWG